MYLAIAKLNKEIKALQQSLEKCIELAVEQRNFEKARELQDVRTDLHNAAEGIAWCNRPPGPERAPDLPPGRRRG